LTLFSTKWLRRKLSGLVQSKGIAMDFISRLRAMTLSLSRQSFQESANQRLQLISLKMHSGRSFLFFQPDSQAVVKIAGVKIAYD